MIPIILLITLSTRIGSIDASSALIASNETTPIHPLVRVHSGLQVFSWIFCIEVANFAAIHYKDTWLSYKMFNEPIWLSVHTCLATFGALCSALSIILIFQYKNYKWSNEYLHPIFGITSGFFALFQILMPILFGAQKDWKGKENAMLFMVHKIVGHATTITTFVTFLCAARMESLKLHPIFPYIIILYYILHATSHIVMFTHRSKTTVYDPYYEEGFKDGLSWVDRYFKRDMQGADFRKEWSKIHASFSFISFIIILSIINFL